jgi:hypothetical protein
MIFEPIFNDAGEIVSVSPWDKEAAELLQVQPEAIVKGIANANTALKSGKFTRKQLEDLSHASNDWPKFTRFITDVAFPSTAKHNRDQLD